LLLLCRVVSFVSISETDWLERLVSEMTYCTSTEKLNSIQSLTDSNDDDDNDSKYRAQCVDV